MDRVGLIAGNGKLPELFLKQCQKNGIELFPVYLFDSVEESIKTHSNSVKYSVAQPGKIISHFKRNGLSHFFQSEIRLYGYENFAFGKKQKRQKYIESDYKLHRIRGNNSFTPKLFNG